MAIERKVKKSFFDQLCDVIEKNTYSIIIVSGLIVLSAAVWFSYGWWVNKKNQSAQYYFGILANEYERTARDKNPEWDSLIARFEKGYEQHAGASILPYYKHYSVKILLNQNRTDEAAVLLDRIIADSASSPMLSLYQIERALIGLDQQEKDMQKKGELSLIALGNDQTNNFYDQALFYLGRYYWSNDQIDQAREVWQKLVDSQVHERIAPSPWVQQVKEYLDIEIV